MNHTIGAATDFIAFLRQFQVDQTPSQHFFEQPNMHSPLVPFSVQTTDQDQFSITGHRPSVSLDVSPPLGIAKFGDTPSQLLAPHGSLSISASSQNTVGVGVPLTSPLFSIGAKGSVINTYKQMITDLGDSALQDEHPTNFKKRQRQNCLQKMSDIIDESLPNLNYNISQNDFMTWFNNILNNNSEFVFTKEEKVILLLESLDKFLKINRKRISEAYDVINANNPRRVVIDDKIMLSVSQQWHTTYPHGITHKEILGELRFVKSRLLKHFSNLDFIASPSAFVAEFKQALLRLSQGTCVYYEDSKFEIILLTEEEERHLFEEVLENFVLNISDETAFPIVSNTTDTIEDDLIPFTCFTPDEQLVTIRTIMITTDRFYSYECKESTEKLHSLFKMMVMRYATLTGSDFPQEDKTPMLYLAGGENSVNLDNQIQVPQTGLTSLQLYHLVLVLHAINAYRKDYIFRIWSAIPWNIGFMFRSYTRNNETKYSNVIRIYLAATFEEESDRDTILALNNRQILTILDLLQRFGITPLGYTVALTEFSEYEEPTELIAAVMSSIGSNSDAANADSSDSNQQEF